LRLLTLKTLFLVAALLVACDVYAADPGASLSVEVVPPGSGPTIPSQAAAHGYTTLVLDADFTRGSHASIYCGSDASQEAPGYDWYIGVRGGLASGNVPCGGNTYPYNDNGINVLRIENGDCCYGGVLGRNGLSGTSFYGTYGRDYPLNAYYECTIRLDRSDLDNLPVWANCFAGDRHTAQGRTPYPPDPSYNDLGLELDINEIHGKHGGCTGGNCDQVAGIINWNCGGPKFWQQPGCVWGNGVFGAAIRKADASFDPANYNTYGMLIKQTDANHYMVCGYINNHQTRCSSQQTINCNTCGGIADNTALCPDVTVFGGNTGCYVAFERPTPLLTLTGQYPDGSEGMNGNTDWSAGARAHMYVKSFRVWSCEAWQTTQCSPYNPN